ncbi:hypothetical protein B0H66DRAFT_529104 [Apodospora peruviana]|uniref:Uncharacterized protein n=1 Tax=Apodospora peruviana TaxID=516989 RepID=A0AAE0MB00_9PEZI|nr:hypothetical protein B0H66DRAFT_529104 [Apodospora peruviana]
MIPRPQDRRCPVLIRLEISGIHLLAEVRSRKTLLEGLSNALGEPASWTNGSQLWKPSVLAVWSVASLGIVHLVPVFWGGGPTERTTTRFETGRISFGLDSDEVRIGWALSGTRQLPGPTETPLQARRSGQQYKTLKLALATGPLDLVPGQKVKK